MKNSWNSSTMHSAVVKVDLWRVQTVFQTIFIAKIKNLIWKNIYINIKHNNETILRAWRTMQCVAAIMKYLREMSNVKLLNLCLETLYISNFIPAISLSRMIPDFESFIYWNNAINFWNERKQQSMVDVVSANLYGCNPISLNWNNKFIIKDWNSKNKSSWKCSQKLS